MLIGATEIRKLIPHSGDMCLLSGVTQWDATHISCTASSHRNPRNPLARDGKVYALTGIEFAAQAMAIHGGLTSLKGKRPRAGFLVNVRDVQSNVECLSDYADDLQIDAEQLMDGGSSVTYSFHIHAGAQELLSGRAMVVLDAEEIKS
ncbi:MAG: hydroxymyristoyl-ACP dehydratase [Nitrosomonadales bacterium]|nr:hydroxymyristoyl-ACP dehydratase [Nitrosomonadales bacterium]